MMIFVIVVGACLEILWQSFAMCLELLKLAARIGLAIGRECVLWIAEE